MGLYVDFNAACPKAHLIHDVGEHDKQHRPMAGAISWTVMLNLLPRFQNMVSS